jgi:hypothetical protein
MELVTTNCPMCGIAVQIMSSDEGTSYYRPLVDSAYLQKKVVLLEEMIDAKEKLHTAYRLCNNRLADQALTKIEKVKKKLKKLEETRND